LGRPVSFSSFVVSRRNPLFLMHGHEEPSPVQSISDRSTIRALALVAQADAFWVTPALISFDCRAIFPRRRLPRPAPPARSSIGGGACGVSVSCKRRRAVNDEPRCRVVVHEKTGLRALSVQSVSEYRSRRWGGRCSSRLMARRNVGAISLEPELMISLGSLGGQGQTWEGIPRRPRILLEGSIGTCPPHHGMAGLSGGGPDVPEGTSTAGRRIETTGDGGLPVIV